MNIRPLKTAIDNLAAHQAQCAARDTTAHLAGLRDGDAMRQWLEPPAQRRRVSWLVPVAVLLGMSVLAAVLCAEPIARTADAMVNPHLEGFE